MGEQKCWIKICVIDVEKLVKVSSLIESLKNKKLDVFEGAGHLILGIDINLVYVVVYCIVVFSQASDAFVIVSFSPHK